MELGTHPWHPFRIPGLCGLRCTSSLLIILTCAIIIPIIMRHDPNSSMGQGNTSHINGIWEQENFGINGTNKGNRQKRSDDSQTRDLSDLWMDHPNPPHPYATNMWWRLTNHTVRMNADTNCYVCAHFPHSTTGGDWWPHQDNDTTMRMTIAAIAAAGQKRSLNTELQKVMTEIIANGLQIPPKEKTMMHDTWIPHALPGRLFAQIATVKHIPTNLTCYERTTGQHYLRTIPRGKCSVVYKPVSDSERKNCMACIRYADYINPPPGPFIVTHATPQPVVAYQYILTSEKGRAKCPSCSGVHIPDEQGTGVIEGYYWLCGFQVYLSLPKNWTGLCAMIQLHGGAIIMPHHSMGSQHRQRRGLFNFLNDSPVPKNQHLWTVAEKLAAAFAPVLGVATLMEQVEITRYELSSFVNTMKNMMEGIQEELRGLRLTALQNRLVLDQLTAVQGGVCSMIGQTCCTYIPDNDDEGHLIEQGIHNISMLSEMIAKGDVTSDPSIWDWFTNMFPSLHHILMLVACILSPVIILLCCWSCIVQATKRVVSPAPIHQMVVYSISDDHLYANA